MGRGSFLVSFFSVLPSTVLNVLLILSLLERWGEARISHCNVVLSICSDKKFHEFHKAVRVTVLAKIDFTG